MVENTHTTAPIPKVPNFTSPDKTSGTRSEWINDVAPFYLDDVRIIYQAMSESCESVTMESSELLGITLENIESTNLQRLTGFSFIGFNPRTVVDLGNNDHVFVTVSGVYEKIDPVFQQLVYLVKLRRKRISRYLRISMVLFWLLAIVTLAILWIILDHYLPINLWSNLAPFSVIPLIVVSVLSVSRPSAVVYPVWKKDAKSPAHIDWRFQFVDLIKLAIVALFSFLLGRYFS